MVMKEKKWTFAESLLHRFKLLDMYGKHIVMTYEGDEKFRTFVGAFVSTLIMSLLFIYFILQLKVLYSRSDTAMSKNTIFKELKDDTEIHKIGEKGIMFGMLIDYNGGDLLADPSYVTYKLRQVSQLYVNSSGSITPQRTKTTINTTLCGTNSFDNVNAETIERLGVDKYLCPDNLEYTIAGNYYSQRFDYIEIKFYR